MRTLTIGNIWAGVLPLHILQQTASPAVLLACGSGLVLQGSLPRYGGDIPFPQFLEIQSMFSDLDFDCFRTLFSVQKQRCDIFLNLIDLVVVDLSVLRSKTMIVLGRYFSYKNRRIELGAICARKTML